VTAVDPASLRSVRALVLDVDGVLTDGRLYYGPSGEVVQSFHVHDGQGIKTAQAAGLIVAALSARRSDAVGHRLRELGLVAVVQGRRDKARALDELEETLGFTDGELAAVGDDVVDLPLLARARFAVAVADAHPSCLARAHYVTRRAGGRGAVREVIDLLLDARAGAP
jgi:3-deoxy-D-manno-octulosonate 8-phosphate phosphatase (KDO 8-P phosphatase)